MKKQQHKRRKERPRVVLDTNIYVSAFGFGGVPRQVFVLAEQENRITVAVSSHILAELEKALQNKLGQPGDEIVDIRQRVTTTAKLINPKRQTNILSPASHPDNRILDLAVAFKADYLISGDRDLLDLEEYKGIPVLTPRQFLNRLQAIKRE
ncbi:MAG: putative toxin-antitoxin system toxin component, PIN family [Candidatus Andersenbacteria bacterium CG10_big_fil_rev_8_21_14_0_10_54_11]|uniref:Putative toxin-antitoxin system toxin component, PIN family n=1 Tax=Candidatus Andersenbacteria bacterium CG10_big_fil_rev_8_21_14_0_10_54_11 TaxID=1974485 RepID=A0A2M6X058_9BACT|nr:MAG: putative toxin-antitoxin system toxin component, PIN family [Candidatus Andersenbacteria bacterium CG10_big_fil_rev_8_21_14_0_10_54_11]